MASGGLLAFPACGDKSSVGLGILLGMIQHSPDKLNHATICGISAGSLVGSILSQIEPGNNVKALEEIKNIMQMHVEFVKPWNKHGTLMSIAAGMLWHKSLYKSNLMDVVKPLWNDTKHRELYVGVTNLTEARYMTIEKPCIELVVASASVPVVFPSITYESCEYCDGALHHVIPIKEIKKYWKSGPLDVLLCYPTDYNEFQKANVPEYKREVYGYVFKTMSEVLYNNMMRDLRELATFCDIPFEKMKEGGWFKSKGRDVRVYVPTVGMYVDFTRRNYGMLDEMHKHGQEVAKKVLERINTVNAQDNGVSSARPRRLLWH